MTKPNTRARSTLSWGLLDQLVSSGATFIFVVFAARSLSAADLGAVAFAFELYLLGVFAARGVSGDPLTSRFSGLGIAELRRPTRAAATTAMLVGLLLGILVAAAASFADQPLRNVLYIVAIAMPGLTLQDYIRSALIVQGRVRATFCNDSLWTFGQLPAMGLAIAIDSSAPVVLAAWALTGCLAAAVGLVQLKCLPARPGTVRGWLRETRDLWPFYLGDNLLFEVATLSFIVIVSATAGLAAMAGFRVAMTVYAPLSLVGRGVISVSVAMLARRRNDPVGVRRSAMLISAILTPMAIGAGLLTLLVPDSLGATFFGASWQEAEPIVFLASFVCAAGLFSTGVSVGLRSLSAGRQSLFGRIFASVGAASAAAIGGVLGEAHGVFLALAIFFPIQATVWWAMLAHATSRRIAMLEEKGDQIEARETVGP